MSDGLFKPRDHADDLEIRRALRTWELERRARAESRPIEALTIMAEHAHRSTSQLELLCNGYIRDFQKLIILLNGGAIVALLAFAGAVFGKGSDATLVAIGLMRGLVNPITLYIAGLLACAISVATTVFFFGKAKETYFAPGQILAAAVSNGKIDLSNANVSCERSERQYKIGLSVSLSLALMSLILFCFASYLAASTFASLGV